MKTDAFENMTLVEFLRQARKLREAADTAELEFLEFLYQVERRPAIWIARGLSFLELLEKENICKVVARYVRYKRVRDGAGLKEMDGAGCEGVMAAGTLHETTSQKEVLAQSKIFRETNGTTVSGQTAAKFARDVKMRAAASAARTSSFLELSKRYSKQKSRIEELEAENAALRAEKQVLKNRIKELETALRARRSRKAKKLA